MKTLRCLFLFVIFCTCFGCAAAQIALEKKDLKVEKQTSDTIFLDIETQGAMVEGFAKSIAGIF